MKARDSWLRKHSDARLKKTKYRTLCFDCEIKRGNWDLSQVPVDANGVKVSPLQG